MFRRAARILAALVALGVLSIGAAALVGVSIDAQRWREPVEAALSRALGRDVRLEGPARLTLSLWPELQVRDLRIANPPGFDSPDLARVGELRVAMDLLPVLRSEVRLREVRGRDVAVRLARAGDGRGNWTLGRGGDDPARAAHVELHRVALENVVIEYAGEGAARRLELAELSAEAPPPGDLRLALRGRDDAFMARATGGPFAALGAAEPWPFELQVTAPGAALNARGTLSGPLDRPAVRASLGAGTADLGAVAKRLHIALPPVGPAAVAAELELAHGGAALRSINAVIEAAAVTGELALDAAGPRPKLTGRLALPALDPGAFAGQRPDTAPVDSLADAFAALDRAGLDLGWLARADADVQVGVARWAGVPGDVRDLDARARIDAGRLVAPFAATIAGARFEGEIAVDGANSPPGLRARLATRDAPVGGLAELLFDAPYVAGSARRFEAMLDARGGTAGALVHDLEARIRIEGAALTYGNFPGARPVAMRLDAAEVSQPRGRTIAGTLRGSLRGKPFSGTLRAGTVERLLRERRTPFGFEGASGSVRARLSGTLAEPADDGGPEIAFDVVAPRARELTPWLGFSSASEAAVALKGTVRVQRGEASLAGASLRFGRSAVDGDVRWRSIGGKPLVEATLVAEVLAPDELRAAVPAAAPRATLLELPILPESLDLADSDVALRVKRFDGLPLAITDAAFAGRMRGGALMPSPFSVRVEGNALAGALALDARGATPTAGVWLAGEDFDLGALLRRLRVTRDVEARIGRVRLYADVRERLLGDVLDHSSFVAEVESGALAFRDPGTRAALRMAIDTGELRASAGAPVSASLRGTAAGLPVALRAQAGRLRELFEPAARLPFALTAETPAAKLAIDGTAVPQRSPDVALSIALSGERLDGLEPLLGASLPPWGPYALTGRLRFSQRGYAVDAVRLALGESLLTGRGALDTVTAPPRFDASLAAERIQLGDFSFGEWSPFEATGTGGPTTVESARRAVREGAQRTHALLGQELLERAYGDFDLVVKRVLHGADELGRGRLRGTVEKGRATIGPVEIEGQAGARASGTLVYEPRERDVVVDAQVKVDRFDYGRLVRTLRPRSDFDGALSLDFRLVATAPRLSAALAYGSGRFDFTVWPERVTGGGFDLWAANLLFRLLPIVDRSASPMNCLMGQFDLVRGRLESQRLVIDTVNTRTEGSGWADFASSELRLRFVPRPKVPQFFSLATPVEAAGTFDDYRFGLRPADAFGTAARWVASPVVVPVQRLFGERVPGDGRDVCANSWR